jgi:excisionase family DNA binding protein
METRLLRVSAVAARLTLSRSKTYELIQTGELRAIRVGRARRVPESEVERFVALRMAEGDREHQRPKPLGRDPRQCS